MLRTGVPRSGKTTASSGSIFGKLNTAGLSTGETAFEVRVECYAGHRGEETPRRVWFDGRTIEMVDVIDAWLALDHRCSAAAAG